MFSTWKVIRDKEIYYTFLHLKYTIRINKIQCVDNNTYMLRSIFFFLIFKLKKIYEIIKIALE